MKTTEKYEQISAKFDSEFIEDDSVLQAESSLINIEDQKNMLTQSIQSGPLSLEDQKFMQNQLYSMIASLNDVMEVLKNDLKQGTRPSAFEAYAKLVNSGRELMTELRDLNKTVVDIQLGYHQSTQNPQATNNIVVMTGDEMLDRLLKIRAASEIHKVEATFDVLADEKPSNIKLKESTHV